MKNFITTALLIAGITFGTAQIAIGTSKTDGKWRVGGGVGLGFGNNGYFGFNVSPFVGYAVAPKLEVGATAGYQYSKNDWVKTNLFSAGPYANFYIIDQLFARGHYEYYTGNQKVESSDQKFSFDESALWLGGGYQSTGKVRFQTGLMYNVLYKEDESIFSSPLRPFGGIAVSL